MKQTEREPPPPPKSVAERLGEVGRPLLAGMTLDLVDLATFGPLGLRAGLALGAIAGWLLAPQLIENGESTKGRFACALLAGLYCAMPGTAVLPLASVMAVVLGLSGDDAPSGPVSREGRARHPDAIDVEFREPDPPADERDDGRA